MLLEIILGFFIGSLIFTIGFCTGAVAHSMSQRDNDNHRTDSDVRIPYRRVGQTTTN